MSQQIETLRGTMRSKTHVRGLAPHPIERDPAYQKYLDQVNAQDSTRYALQRVLRALTPCTLAELTHDNIYFTIQKLSADGYKRDSVDRYLRILKAFLSWCSARRYVMGNAAIDVKTPAMGDVRRRTPATVDTEKRNLLDVYYKTATAEEQFFWACIKSGCRISEPAMAVAGDVEVHEVRGQISVDVWMGSKDYRKGKRKVDMPLWVIPAIIALLEVAQGNAGYPLMYLKGTKVIFPQRGRTDTTIRHRAKLARDAFYAIQSKVLGEKVANPHAFRSDHATRSISEHPTDFMIEKLSQRNGYNPATLREHYAYLLKSGPDISDV